MVQDDRKLQQRAVERVEDRPRVDAAREMGEAARIAVPVDARQAVRLRVRIVRQIRQRDDQVCEEDAGAGYEEEGEERACQPRPAVEDRRQRRRRRQRLQAGAREKQGRQDRDPSGHSRKGEGRAERRQRREDQRRQDEVGPADDDGGVEPGNPIKPARPEADEGKEGQQRNMTGADKRNGHRSFDRGRRVNGDDVMPALRAAQARRLARSTHHTGFTPERRRRSPRVLDIVAASPRTSCRWTPRPVERLLACYGDVRVRALRR